MSKSPHTILGCGIAVIRDEKILLAERLDPTKPGYGLFSMPGGTVDEGESPANAAERELLEETGLRAVTIEALPFWHWTDKWHPHHPWLTLYYRTTAAGEPRTMEPEKQGPWGWYGLSGLPLNTWHGAARALRGALGLL